MTASLPSHAGTIVIGAGTGGAACAGLLAEHSDEPVLVLDAGPDYGPFDPTAWPGDMLDAKSIPLSHDWGLTSAPPQSLDLPRARIVGGCSAHNGCTVSRSARADYDGWAAAGQPRLGRGHRRAAAGLGPRALPGPPLPDGRTHRGPGRLRQRGCPHRPAVRRRP